MPAYNPYQELPGRYYPCQFEIEGQWVQATCKVNKQDEWVVEILFSNVPEGEFRTRAIANHRAMMDWRSRSDTPDELRFVVALDDARLKIIDD